MEQSVGADLLNNAPDLTQNFRSGRRATETLLNEGWHPSQEDLIVFVLIASQPLNPPQAVHPSLTNIFTLPVEYPVYDSGDIFIP